MVPFRHGVHLDACVDRFVDVPIFLSAIFAVSFFFVGKGGAGDRPDSITRMRMAPHGSYLSGTTRRRRAPEDGTGESEGG